MTPHQPSSPLGTLSTLPLEIRELIYTYLTPPARLPTILRARHIGVSSLTHRPPPLALLLTSSATHHESLAVYHRKCEFKIDGILDPANVWPLWQVEEVLGNSAAHVLARIRRIELNLFWHRLPDGGAISTALATVAPGAAGGLYGYGGVCKSEVDKRVERLGRTVQVLRRAGRLRQVTLTWKEIPVRGAEGKVDWEAKQRVLRTLERLSGVRMVPGDLIVSEEVEGKICGLLREVNLKTEGGTQKDPKAVEGARHEYLDLLEPLTENNEGAVIRQTQRSTKAYFH